MTSGTLSTSASRPKVKHATESLLFGIDFAPLLATGELLAGVPVVVPSGSPTAPPLVVGTPVVNGDPFANDEGGVVPVGAGVQVRLAGGLAPVDYVLTVTCSTTAGNVRTLVCTLQVRDA